MVSFKESLSSLLLSFENNLTSFPLESPTCWDIPAVLPRSHHRASTNMETIFTQANTEMLDNTCTHRCISMAAQIHTFNIRFYELSATTTDQSNFNFHNPAVNEVSSGCKARADQSTAELSWEEKARWMCEWKKNKGSETNSQFDIVRRQFLSHSVQLQFKGKKKVFHQLCSLKTDYHCLLLCCDTLFVLFFPFFFDVCHIQTAKHLCCNHHR